VKGKKRHDFSYAMLGVFLRSYLTRRFNYKYDTVNVDHSPYIVISNHLTNWDPFLVGLSFKKSMYYVATDHIFRMGLVSKIIKFLISPIPRLKTAHETQTVISIFRRLKEHCNICIFAEGNASFDGQTGKIPFSIGKLVKRSGAALVTYRLSGAYFSYPRWARFHRTGKMTGRLARVYSPETLAAMTEEEIYSNIKNDLYVNAYEDQKKNPVAFTGKRPAEYLETVLYCCPECKKFSTLKSNNDRLFCECGFAVRFNEYGYFEMPDSDRSPPFKTIHEWTKWQKKEIEKLVSFTKTLDNNTPLFSDHGQTLFEIERVTRNIEIARGILCLYNDRISIIKKSGEVINFPFTSIIDMSIITMMKIIFSASGTGQKFYEIHSDHPRSALKYLDAFRAWQSGVKGG
jgi:1-acyl-sn-glycerol-3-phosphate acyltransferase